MTIYDIIAWIFLTLVCVAGLVYIYKHPERWMYGVKDKNGNVVDIPPYF